MPITVPRGRRFVQPTPISGGGGGGSSSGGSPPVGSRFSTGEDIAALFGPSSAPGGAVTVSPSGTRVDALTQSNPAGTTFYLLAGTHYVGGATPTAFDQVVPKAGNVYIGAPGAVLDGRGVNRYAFTGSATGVQISTLEVKGFACFLDEFVVNHDAATDWTLTGCNIHDNTGASVGVGSGTTLTQCWLHDNSQYGFSSYKPPVNSGATNSIDTVMVDRCEVNNNGTLSDEVNPNGTPTYNGRNGGCKFWDTHNITVKDSWIHDSNYVGLWADTNNTVALFDNLLVENNYAEGLMYEISYNFKINNCTIRRNAIGKGKIFANQSDNFPVAAVYISESGGDTAVSATYATSEITGCTFTDNWGDLTVWENADRFCNSPANTSSKVYKPLGHGATLGICNNPSAKTLTISTTAGSPNFTVTSGTLESTDEGRAASGSGISGGTILAEPTNANNFVGGFLGATSGRLSANATATATGVTLTLAAGAISTTGFGICRWLSANIHVHANTFSHDAVSVLGSYTLPPGVRTGKIALLSQFGTFPTWSPYQGATVQNAVTFNQNNVWSNNTYTGGYSFMAHDTGVNATFSTWVSTYSQDSGSTLGGTGTGPAPFLSGHLVGDRNMRPGSALTDSGGTYRTVQVARVSVSALQLTFGNWYVNADPTGDTIGANNYTINKCYLEHGGALTQVLFPGAATSYTLTPGENVHATVTKTIAAGDTYYIRSYVTPAASGSYPRLSMGSVDYPGEVSRKGADHANEIGITNLTDFGDVFGPIAITGTVTSGTQNGVAVLGDSIAYGIGDDFSTSGHLGFLYRALLGNRSFLIVPLSGESAARFLTNGTRRATYVGPAAKYLICEYGVNDLQGGANLATAKASLIQVWTEARSRAPAVRTLQTTITPKSSSTDGWATVGNQTTDGTVEAVRPALNAWIRAGAPMVGGVGVAPGTGGALVAGNSGHPLVDYLEIADLVESARDSGKWKASHTGDGVHPNVTGHLAMVPGVDLSKLT